MLGDRFSYTEVTKGNLFKLTKFIPQNKIDGWLFDLNMLARL